tara:strand:+ start:3180 stop:3410 length:231 start_codon:yes stop_codon:yes gene_type:complete
MVYLSILPLIPLLFYLADGYRDHNLKKGAIYILVFLLVGIISYYLLSVFGMLFPIAIPFLILFMVLLKAKQKSHAP